MNGYFELAWMDVAISLGLVAALVAVSAVARLGIIREVLIGTVRTFIQLLLVGYVLKIVFDLSQWYWTLTMLAVMVAVATRTAGARDDRGAPGRFRVAGVAITAGVVVTMVTVIGIVIRIRPWYTPEIVVPISGMVIAATMNAVALTATRFRSEMKQRRATVDAALALGATAAVASRVPMREAMRAALIPTVNALMIVGLVQLPGMMSGQIIAGVLSVQAVRYQIVVMYMIACGAGVGSLVAALQMRRLFFTERHRIRSEMVG
jgi:putative ABC transport system permease protein